MKHLLIIDDNKRILAKARSMLADTYLVTTVTSGGQALEYLKEGDCDLILLDMNMPDMDGFEAMRRLRAIDKCRETPIVFLTEVSDRKTENKCIEEGASDFIVMPFAVNVMRARIKRIIELDDLRKNLEEKLEERTRHIVDIQHAVVTGMASMVESRDDSTGGHIRRTSRVVEIFARRLLESGAGFSKKFLEMVTRAAPMHDLGKIAIDDAILKKQGNFTGDDHDRMKTHSAEGAKIVKKILDGVEEDEFVKIAVNIAHYHHERWDGAGYPEGLKGEQIPVEARIMALADVFDALVSKRCYKQALPFKDVFEIIKNGAGSQFDPELCKSFLDCRPELERLYSEGDNA